MSKYPPFESSSPWHDGERTVRRRVGVEDRLEAIGPRAIINSLLPAHRAFYAKLPYAVVGTVDESGYPWATLIAGPPGFICAPDVSHLLVNGRLHAGDPAGAGWKAKQEVAVLGIDLLRRRRIRANGVLITADANHALLQVRQAFGNCPKYIHARDVSFAWDPTADWKGDVETTEELSETARTIIASADTFFVSSYTDRQDNIYRAVDISHRGGKPGFVRVEGNRLSIPDFTGNQYFNTLGNFVHIPRAGLVFLGFETGDLLQVTGEVTLDFDSPELRAFASAERIWHVDVRRCVLRQAILPLRFNSGEPSPIPDQDPRQHDAPT